MSDTTQPVNDAEIKAALVARRGDWTAIHQRAGVSHSWISKFVRGRIPNPGLNTLRKVRAAIAECDESKAGA